MMADLTVHPIGSASANLDMDGKRSKFGEQTDERCAAMRSKRPASFFPSPKSIRLLCRFAKISTPGNHQASHTRPPGSEFPGPSPRKTNPGKEDRCHPRSSDHLFAITSPSTVV